MTKYNFTTKTDYKVYILIVILIILLFLLGLFLKSEKRITIYASQKPTPVALLGISGHEFTTKEILSGVFGDKTNQAMKVAFCESSLNPTAKHKLSSAKGLFQIIDSTWKRFKCDGDPFNTLDNATCAKLIYDHSGWHAWYASYKCHGFN